MAAQAESSAKVDPQLVGNSFVEQYFKALHQYPEHLHRFYQDSSFLSRPGPDGVMTSITTMKVSALFLTCMLNRHTGDKMAIKKTGPYDYVEVFCLTISALKRTSYRPSYD